MGLLRLRKCSDEGTFRPELVRRPAEPGSQRRSSDYSRGENAVGVEPAYNEDEEDEQGGSVSIIRELHVYGTAVPVHGRDPTKFQHQVSGGCFCYNLSLYTFMTQPLTPN